MVNERIGQCRAGQGCAHGQAQRRHGGHPRARAEGRCNSNKDVSRKSHLLPVSAAGGLFLRSSDNTL